MAKKETKSSRLEKILLNYYNAKLESFKGTSFGDVYKSKHEELVSEILDHAKFLKVKIDEKEFEKNTDNG